MGEIMDEMLFVNEEGEQFNERGEQFMIYFEEFSSEGLVLILEGAVSDYF